MLMPMGLLEVLSLRNGRSRCTSRASYKGIVVRGLGLISITYLLTIIIMGLTVEERL